MKNRGDWIRAWARIIAALIIVSAGIVTWFSEHEHLTNMQHQIDQLELGLTISEPHFRHYINEKKKYLANNLHCDDCR